MDEMLALNEFEHSAAFSDKDRAALAFAEEITVNNRHMRQEVKDRVKAHLSDAELVDLTLACCIGNFMNRLNDCLGVDLDVELPDELVRLLEATPAPAELAAGRAGSKG